VVVTTRNAPVLWRLVVVCTASALASGMRPLAAMQQPRAVRAEAAHTSATVAAFLRTVDERVARGDSSGALALLEGAVSRDRTNGALWHRLGMLRWGGRLQSVREIDDAAVIRLISLADSALRYATQLAPDSGQFWLDYGRFIRFTDNSARRNAAQAMFDAPIAKATRAGNMVLAAALHDEMGMGAFRNYELEMNRYQMPSPVTFSGTQLPIVQDPTVGFVDQYAAQKSDESFRTSPRHERAKYLREHATMLSPASGASDFAVATRAFANAVSADPSNARARQHQYMVFAEAADWRSLLASAQRSTARDSNDVQAWLAIGIAAQRLDQYAEAAAAFDNALRRMDERERSAFTNLSRLLIPNQFANSSRFPDSIAYAAMIPSERSKWESTFWHLADPRMRTNVNEALIEYLARVAFSDLRFSYEELDVRGSNSDRGMVYIRYGPPENRYGPGDAIWTYRNGRIFYFRPGLTFANASFSPNERERFRDSIAIVDPVGWDNMPLVRNTLPMRMRVSTFRASADSMDAVVAAAIPVRSLLGEAEFAGRFPIEIQLDVNDARGRIVGREVRTSTVATDSLPIGINGTWVRRVGRGLNVVRVDAVQNDVNRAATSMVDAVVDTTAGFAMSDLLLGTEPQRVNSKDPARWRDVSIAPNSGQFRVDQPVGAVWETYDLQEDSGNAKYRTTISIERAFPGVFAGFFARIRANVRSTVEGDGSSAGRVRLSYDQLRPSGRIVTDFVSVSLSGAVPGRYRLDIEVLDLVSGKRTSRRTEFVLAPN